MACILDSLTDITLEWWDARRFCLGFIVGWITCSVALIIMISLIKLGVETL